MSSPLGLLARFSRAVSEVSTDEEILPLLADALIDHVGAAACAVVRVVGEHARVVASRGLPPAVDEWHLPVDELGDDLGRRFVEAAGEKLSRARVRPLISHRNLFGAVVMLFRADAEPTADRLELADALLDLAAVALVQLVQIEELRHARDELRKTQRALVQAEKLRALGQMAGGVAHDLKNILNPLSMQAQIILQAAERGDTDEIAETVEDLRAVLDRGVQTIDRLRDYGRQKSEASAAPVELDRLVEEAVMIAKPRLATSKLKIPRITVELGSPPAVAGRADEILNALVNLTINAIDAMHDLGGTVTLRTGVEDGRPFVQVRDTGPGIPSDVADRVFEPFFSTKGDQGTGLGLPMVYACMQHHGGTVELDTAPGQGACFTLRFPAAVA
jgi:signal transduction histidine kinase